MKKFKVTIARNWSVEVEAEDGYKARRAAIKSFQGQVTNKLSYTLLYKLTSIEALEKDPKLKAHFKTGTINLEDATEESKQHFVGFFEGDGSLSLYDKRKPQLNLGQKDPRILEYIKTLFNLDENLHRSEQAGVWSLMIIKRAHVVPLLGIIKERVVSPQRVEQINQVLGINDAAEHRPTWPWLAGFVDAEGHLAYSVSSLHLSVWQKDTRILYKIQRFVGFGSVYEGNSNSIQWSGENAWKVISKTYRYLRNPDKKEQAYALATFFGKVK